MSTSKRRNRADRAKSADRFYREPEPAWTPFERAHFSPDHDEDR